MWPLLKNDIDLPVMNRHKLREKRFAENYFDFFFFFYKAGKILKIMSVCNFTVQYR